MTRATFRIWRGNAEQGGFEDYPTEVSEGMVVLDAVHRVQADQAGDLAVRWNCKAGKCGSCSAEINGKPRLMCMTRLDTLNLTEPVTVEPMRAFPLIKDLVTDVSWNYRVKQGIQRFQPKPREKDGTWRMSQRDADRVQEFRKCIECFLCQDVCHVIRDHEDKKRAFAGPRFFIKLAGLDMHPLDTRDRARFITDEAGVGLCNITKCCTTVCPEHIQITDNGIIPLKERAADALDPVVWLLRKFRGQKSQQA